MWSIKSYRSAEEIALFSDSFSAVTRSISASVSLAKLTLERNEIHNTDLFINSYDKMVYWKIWYIH